MEVLIILGICAFFTCVYMGIDPLPLGVEIGDVYFDERDGSYFTIEKRGFMAIGDSAAMGYEGKIYSTVNFRGPKTTCLTLQMPRHCMRFGMWRGKIHLVSHHNEIAKARQKAIESIEKDQKLSISQKKTAELVM